VIAYGRDHTDDRGEPLPETLPVAARGANVPDLDEFLDQPEPEHDDVIPGTLERGERVILTAAEGAGKSTLLRQLAVQVAAGVHPWTGEQMPPVRVLLLDLENSERHVRRKLRPLRIAAHGYAPGQLRVFVRPQGLDVLRREDAAWLRGIVDHVGPDLLVVGPSYKLVGGEAEKEQPARALTTLLDELRVRHGMAVLLEAHMPYAATGQRRRPTRPYGSSLWSRWPEFGLSLDEDGRLGHWRGVREEGRGWPRKLRRGGAWPWTVDEQAGPTGPSLRPAEARVLALLRQAEAEPLKVREIAERSLADGGNGLSIRTVQAALDALGGAVDYVEIDGRGTRQYLLSAGSRP